MAGKVIFDEKRCKGCELCITVCPVKIIKLNDQKPNHKGYYPAHVEEMDKCTACAACAKICPDVVIRVEKY
jgi:2-oxoglutarate ferredoxin oxidoreductase subunit delta